MHVLILCVYNMYVYVPYSSAVNIKLVVAITVPVTVILLAISGLLVSVVYVCVVVQKRRTQHLQFPTTSPAHTHWTHDLELAKQSVGQSSPDLPYQVLTDIKDIVKLNYQIERGRFGVFYHGYYEEEEIVLKRFEERDRSAWLRESLMYNSILQSHENVLAFFASAMTNSDDSSPEYWLATKYHEFGSLQDYLRQHTVEAEVILQMTASICSGLAHLHSDRSYNQAKISVAHCNLTSRNILVKDNLSCCIGDFRLAVFKYKNEVNLPDNAAPGTIRYMAPELLSEPVSHLLSFETFKQADVYALGLVLWKICQRGSCYGGTCMYMYLHKPNVLYMYRYIYHGQIRYICIYVLLYMFMCVYIARTVKFSDVDRVHVQCMYYARADKGIYNVYTCTCTCSDIQWLPLIVIILSGLF